MHKNYIRIVLYIIKAIQSWLTIKIINITNHSVDDNSVAMTTVITVAMETVSYLVRPYDGLHGEMVVNEFGVDGALSDGVWGGEGRRHLGRGAGHARRGLVRLTRGRARWRVTEKRVPRLQGNNKHYRIA